jgi:HSP20 family protein
MATDTFRDFDRFVQQVTGTPSRPAAMPMDAYKQGDQFVIHLDLPGVDPSSIDLSIEKHALTVRAERRRVVGEDIETLVRERPWGSFARRFTLGDSLDADRIEASYADGVLTLTVPMAEKAKARKIDVALGASKAQAAQLVTSN